MIVLDPTDLDQLHAIIEAACSNLAEPVAIWDLLVSTHRGRRAVALALRELILSRKKLALISKVLTDPEVSA